MIKVLHLISGGDTGGAKTHIFSLMKGLEGKAKAKIICFIPGPFYDEAREQGFDIELIQQKNRFDLTPMKKISVLIERENYDIIHCHGARANFNAGFMMKHHSIPFITTLHSDYLLDFKDNLIKNKIFTPLNANALKKFDDYIAITQRFANMLVDRGFDSNHIYVAYNGIDMDKEEVMVSQKEFLRRYDLPGVEGKMIFTIAARLDQVKDHMTLLRAIQRVKEEIPEAYFLIAGDGHEKENLQTYVREHGLEEMVSFLGFVNDPFSLFQLAQVNLLTSLSESFPYALLEGAKAGIPFIATDVGGISEMMGEKGGSLFPVGDDEALSEILIYYHDHPQEVYERGQYLKNYVSENFSAEAMAVRHMDIYQKILTK